MSDLTRDDDKKYLAKGWGASEEEASKTSSWVKLDPGQHIEIVPVGEPEVFEKTFKHDGEEPKTSKRWSIDVWIPKEKALKVWEMSRTTFGDLRRQREIRGGDFPKALLRLERIGSGMNTKYALDFLRVLAGNELDELNVKLIKSGVSPDDAPF